MKQQPKALILGGKTGLVGQALVEVLKGAYWDITCTDRKDIDFFTTGFADDLERLIDRVEPDCIFNGVGFTQVDAAEDNTEGADVLNRLVPATLGRIVASTQCKLVHYSTDFVFNGRKETPYSTEDIPAPLNVYGKTKLAGENALLELGLSGCIIARTAWLFGPGRNNFVDTIITKGKDRGQLSVVHDQVGSPTYTLDLAAYTLKLVEAEVNGVFHIVNSGEASWCELADEAIALAQVDCTVTPVPSSAYPQKAIRPIYSVLDTSSLTRATGITPRPWPQALRDYVFRSFPPSNNG